MKPQSLSNKKQITSNSHRSNVMQLRIEKRNLCGNWKLQIENLREVGFTLIELIIVFTLMTILSTIGIAAFVTYSQSQEVESTIQDIKTTLTTARSRALSQLKQGTCADPNSSLVLQGYEVLFCNELGVSCYPPKDIANPDYEMNIVCSQPDGSGITHEVVYDKKFPNSNISYSSKTTASSFFFAAVTATVTTNNATSNPSQISIKGYGITKVATSSATGVIQ